MTEADRIVIERPTDSQLSEMSARYGKEHEPSPWIGRLKKFGKGVVNSVRTMLMSQEKFDQQLEEARADFEASSKNFHEYRLANGDSPELLVVTPRGNTMATNEESRLRTERFNAANKVMTGLEKQWFTRRIGRPALVAAAAIVGGAVAAWQFKDAAFLHTAVEHAQLTHGSGVEFVPTPDVLPTPPDVFTLPIESSSSGLITGESDSYWGIATELWQQKGVERPDIGQINDVKNILMQHGPSHPNGHLYPGDIVDSSAAQAFINNAIGVK